MIELTYHGQPIAFQRPRYDSRNHRSFNSTRYSNAKKAMADFIRTNAPGAYFDCPLRLLVNFYRQDRRAVDLDNLVKALCDALQDSGVIKNDSQIEWLWAKRIYDKHNPRTHFVLAGVETKEEGTSV